jgi:hypothetical protein
MMNRTILLTIVLMAMSVQIMPAMAGSDCGQSCTVRIPRCDGCYTMTASASLDTNRQGTTVEGSSTAITRDVGTSVSIDASAKEVNTAFIAVGSEVTTNGQASYGTFDMAVSRHEMEADIDMSSIVVVDDCQANARTSIGAELEGSAIGGDVEASYGVSHNQVTIESISTAFVTGHDAEINDPEATALANNDGRTGSVIAQIELGTTTIGSYAGASYYQSHFGGHDN